MTQLTDAELARLEHENMVEMMATVVANVDNTLMRRAGGVVLLATGLPARLFNQVLVEGDDASEDALARAVETIRENGDPFLVNLRVGPDDRFISLMDSLGLVSGDQLTMPGMALYPIPSGEGPALAGYEIVRLVHRSQLEDHVRTAARALGMPQEWARAVVGSDILDSPAFSLYTGYADGEPVTTGLGFHNGRTIGVYNIGTVPAARRHGYAEAMTRQIADDAVEDGCDVAILQASAMGLSIYRRMGYRAVLQYRGYIEPET